MGEEQEQKFHQLTEEPVSRMISHLAVPCIISMLVTAFYNMADTFFVGMLRSNAATGAVGMVDPCRTHILGSDTSLFFHDGGDPGCGLFLRPRQRQLHLPGAGAAQYGFGL